MERCQVFSRRSLKSVKARRTCAGEALVSKSSRIRPLEHRSGGTSIQPWGTARPRTTLNGRASHADALSSRSPNGHRPLLPDGMVETPGSRGSREQTPRAGTVHPTLAALFPDATRCAVTMLGDDPLDVEYAGAAVPSSLGGAAHLCEASRAGVDHLGHQTVTHDRALADDHDALFRFVGLVVGPSGSPATSEGSAGAAPLVIPERLGSPNVGRCTEQDSFLDPWCRRLRVATAAAPLRASPRRAGLSAIDSAVCAGRYIRRSCHAGQMERPTRAGRTSRSSPPLVA